MRLEVIPISAVISAGIVPARRTAAGWRVLILRAYRNWDFPKGRIEAGEAPLAAALREAREETGVTDLHLEFGEIHRDTAPYSRGKIARYFLAVTEKERIVLPVSPELGRPEHHEWRWATFDEAARLLPQLLQPICAWARETLEAVPGDSNTATRNRW